MNFFVDKENVKDNCIYIDSSDVNHIKNVLRKSIGDILDIVSDNIKYKAEISEMSQDMIKCDILEVIETENRTINLTIFQGLAKADKIEYIIQKCTELGVYEIIPTEMKRCVVRLDGKDKEKKLERWKKIAEVASKQSLRNDILKVDKIMSFKNMLEELEKYDLVILAYEKENDTSLKNVLENVDSNVFNIAVIIGPEGGIDESEAVEITKLGAKSVTLGKRILRTETAPVAISAMIMYELEY